MTSTKSIVAPFRRKFTQEEDNEIKYLVEEAGIDNWLEIAEKLGTRTAKQCRDRYNNYLSPGITNMPWSAEEDQLLRDKVAEFGNKWTQIAIFFPCRGSNNLKNRWHKVLSKEPIQPLVVSSSQATTEFLSSPEYQADVSGSNYKSTHQNTNKRSNEQIISVVAQGLQEFSIFSNDLAEDNAEEFFWEIE